MIGSKEQQLDIRVIPPKPNGHDKVIGDLHGNSDCLKAVLDSLEPDDRLFIVGDLTDRGEDNVGVINLINNNKDRIFVIRGNHESLCLKAISGLEKMAAKKPKGLAGTNNNAAKDAKNAISKKLKGKKHKEAKTKFTKQYGSKGSKDVLSHVRNGGDWLVELFQKELRENKIRIGDIDESTNERTITYSANSEVKKIKEFMENLPYIIHVPGVNPLT